MRLYAGAEPRKSYQEVAQRCNESVAMGMLTAGLPAAVIEMLDVSLFVSFGAHQPYLPIGKLRFPIHLTPETSLAR